MVIFVQQTRRLRFEIFIQLSLQTTRMPCDFTLAVVFDTSTSGRFVKLKTKNLAIISKYTTVPNLIKQLFHSRLLDMRWL